MTVKIQQESYTYIFGKEWKSHLGVGNHLKIKRSKYKTQINAKCIITQITTKYTNISKNT